MADTTRPAPAAPPLLKRLNEQTVLELVRALAPVSRAEISRRAGISKPTVSLALRSLVEAGLVRESADAPSGPSYGAVYFEPVPEAALVLGLDLGARFLRGAICDLSGTIRARQDVELQGADAERALAAVAELRDALVAATGLPRELIDGVVVGVPGVTGSADGTLRLAANVPGLEGRSFEADLEARLGLSITLENDINLAALGERWLGVARGVDDFVFLSVGTGMGAGVVLRGELHTGRHGFAGEIDFALDPLDEDVDPAAPQIAELAAGIAEQHEGTSLRAPFDARSVFDAARQGDEAAQLVVNEVARRIALHLAPVAAVVDVELVVLGGGIGSNGDLLLAPVRRLLASWLPFPPQVEVSTVGEAAVLAGALAVGLRAALESVARAEVA
jgi:predicted NBD/HSP70 family sugar kinase/DNA-binding CsgD family transcriptional regulator